MKTVDEFIASLSKDEQACIKHMDAAGVKLKGYILLDEVVVETSFIVAVFWLMHNEDKIRVAKTKVRGVEVSTVFLTVPHGTNHFETMCFGREYEQVSRRYKTIAQARIGHVEIVTQVRNQCY